MINLKKYNENGFYFPLYALNPDKIEYYRKSVYSCNEHNKKNPKIDCLNKSYLLFNWANSLIREENIINQVSKVLGPNLFCYSMNIFLKPARSESFVSPHQDSSYWFLNPPNLLTAWVALTDVDIDQGPISYWSKTHTIGDIPFETIESNNNLLKSGQTTKLDYDKYDKSAVLLKAGQMSMHHLMTVHGSEKNTSDKDRIGVAIRYMSTNVMNTKMKKSAMLIAGNDAFNYWHHEKAPNIDLGKDEISEHRKSMGKKTILQRLTSFF